MSQTKKVLSRIEVRQRPDSGMVMTGANTEVLLDGKPIPGITFFKLEVKAGGVAKIMMEMVATVDVNAAVDLPYEEGFATGYETQTQDGVKSVVLRRIGSLFPTAIATKSKTKPARS